MEAICENFSGIHRILAAVDASEQACFAADLAGRLCRDLGAELLLVHVAAVPLLTGEDMFYDHSNTRTECIEEGKDLLAEHARRLAPLVHAETSLAEGDTVTAIVEMATGRQCNLIVIGTHGRGRLAAAVMGSVSQGVIRKAPCPVICVLQDPCPRPLQSAAAAAIDELDDEIER